MKKRRFLRVAAVGCAVLLSTSSWALATTIEPTQGVVLVNNGKGFVQIKKPIKARPGSSVMVSPDGAAKVVYSDGCKVDIHPGEVTTIADLSPCASGSSAQTGDYGWCSGPASSNYSCATYPMVGATLATIGAIIYLATSP